jgi:hypothetical protein
MIGYIRPPTMFGFHVSIGSRNGFSDFLRNCAVAGRAVSGTKCFKNGGGLETTTASDKSYVVWRTDAQYHFPNGKWDEYSDNPPYDYSWPPDQSATIAKGWMEGCWRIWRFNKAHFYEPYNEPNPSNVLQMTNLIAFSRECMRLADTQYGGIKLAIGGFSSGTPTEVFIEMMSPLLDEMAQRGHILALHDGAATPEYVLFKDAYVAGSALRWRLWKSIQDANNRLMPYVYSTETYCPEFYHEYGKSIRQQDMFWYLQEAAKDAYLLGTAMFELGDYNFGGGSVNLENAIPTLQEIVTQLIPIAPETPVDSDVQVGIPYMSQNNKVSANDSSTDCGAACLAMGLNSYDEDVTVNDVFRKTGAQPGQPISFAQLQTAAVAFGYYLEDKRDQTLYILRAMLRDGARIILLVNARYINQPGKSTPYLGPHYVVPVGYLSDGTIKVHDPNNLPAVVQPNLDVAWGECHEQDNNPDRAMLVLHKGTPIEPPIEPPTTTTALSGVSTAEARPLTSVEIEALRVSRVPTAKLLTVQDPEEARVLVDQVRSVASIKSVIARLMFPANVDSPFTSQQFVDYCGTPALVFYSEGIRYFEVHNEPNLLGEGWKWNWANGAKFGEWFNEVCLILRRTMPNALFGFPGLSPQFTNTDWCAASDRFIQEASAAVAGADWFGVHSYWQDRGVGHWQMDSEDGGMYWRSVQRLFPNKLLMLTEYSCNSPIVPDVDKALMYTEFLKKLKGMKAAYAFCLAWPGKDTNHEGWVRDGVMTQIPQVLGQL